MLGVRPLLCQVSHSKGTEEKLPLYAIPESYFTAAVGDRAPSKGFFFFFLSIQEYGEITTEAVGLTGFQILRILQKLGSNREPTT